MRRHRYSGVKYSLNPQTPNTPPVETGRGAPRDMYRQKQKVGGGGDEGGGDEGDGGGGRDSDYL